MTSDPTRSPGPSWNALLRVFKQMDSDIESFYVQHGVKGMRSRFVKPLIRLSHEGPKTISELASTLDSTHSATSQTVATMKQAGFVETLPGPDGRTQVVSLTPKSRELIPLLEAEWRATDAAVEKLDDELGGAVTTLVEQLEQTLLRRSMAERLQDELGL